MNTKLALTQNLSICKELTQAVAILKMSTEEIHELVDLISMDNPFIVGQYRSMLPFEGVIPEYNETTFYEKLTEQIKLMPLSDTESKIALVLADHILESGYINYDIQNLLVLLNQNSNVRINTNMVNNVLLKLQQYIEPTGIGARDLKECLVLQLQELHNTKISMLAIRICKNHLNLVGKQDLKALAKIYHENIFVINSAIKLIKSLNAKPGLKLTNANVNIVPDLKILNSPNGFELHVEKAQIYLVNNKPSNKTEQHALTEAKTIKKSITYRNQHLHKIGLFIMQHQQEFLLQGPKALKPIVKNLLAEYLDVHLSTVSRILEYKYIQTPFGTFKLSYFFKNLQNHAKSVIKSHIQNFLADNYKLTDAKIVNLLSQKGYNLARRTVNKYKLEVLKGV